MNACPYRQTFFEKLATDPEGGAPVSKERMDADLDKWLAALAAIVARLNQFYTAGKHDKGF